MVVTATAVVYIVAYILVALARMRYPFELEFMEGNFLVQLERVVHGQPLFVAPSLTYAPMVYGPLYFYLSGLVAKVTGTGFTPMRLVSFLSSLGCFGLLYRFVSRETQNNFCALVSVGLFAATFRETGYWFDLARTDSLYIFLAVLAAYLLRWRRDARSLALAGACMGLSFLTKQTAAIVILPLLPYSLALGRRAFTAFAISAGALGLGGVAILHLLTGGWSSFYLFSVPSTVLSMSSQILLFWTRDILQVLPIAAGFCLLYFLLPTPHADGHSTFFYGCLGAGTLAASWLYSLNWGAYLNGRLPGYFFLCLCLGLGLHRALALVPSTPMEAGVPWGTLVLALVLMQFCALLYNPVKVIPTEKDVEAGRRVVAEIAKIRGPVYVPYHPYLPIMAGKQPFAQMMNLRFLFLARDQKAIAPLRQELREAFAQRKFSGVVTDADWNHEIVEDVYKADLLENYAQTQEIAYPDGGTFRPATGLLVRPAVIYLPRAAAP